MSAASVRYLYPSEMPCANLDCRAATWVEITAAEPRRGREPPQMGRHRTVWAAILMPCRRCGSCDHIKYVYGGVYIVDLQDCGGRTWYDALTHMLGRYPPFFIREVQRPEAAQEPVDFLCEGGVDWVSPPMSERGDTQMLAVERWVLTYMDHSLVDGSSGYSLDAFVSVLNEVMIHSTMLPK